MSDFVTESMKGAWDNLEVHTRKTFIFINIHLKFILVREKRRKSCREISVLEDPETVLTRVLIEIWLIKMILIRS